MANCYICETKIRDENLYREHILLNSLGGKLKSSSLICRNCAPYFDAIDAALSKQLNPIGLLLNIKRDRGSNPSLKATITKTGEEIFIGAGGKPIPIKPTIDDSVIDGQLHLSISARDEKQMREVLKGLKRKHPWIDVQSLLNNAVLSRDYLTSPVHHEETVGGDEAFRAICKMAIGFYLHQGGMRDFITHLIPYIKDGQPTNCVRFFYPDDFTAMDGEKLSVLHTLYVRGDLSEEILFAHIDFFSTFKFLVLLSDRYHGKSFQETYSFDVINCTAVNQEMEIEISRKEVLDLLAQHSHPMQDINKAWINLQQALRIKQTDDYLSKLTKEVVEKHFKGIGEGTIFNQQMAAELARDLAESYVTFMYRDELR